MGTVTRMDAYEHLRGRGSAKGHALGAGISLWIPNLDSLISAAQQASMLQRAIILANLNFLLRPFGFEVKDIGTGILDLYRIV